MEFGSGILFGIRFGDFVLNSARGFCLEFGSGILSGIRFVDFVCLTKVFWKTRTRQFLEHRMVLKGAYTLETLIAELSCELECADVYSKGRC